MKLLIFFILLFNIVLFGQGKDNNIVLKAEDERTGEIENIKRKIDGSLQIFSTNTASNPVYISYPEHYHDSSQIINIPNSEVMYGSNIGTLTSNTNITISGSTLTATYFVGDGSQITNISASAIPDSFVKNYESDTLSGDFVVTGQATADTFSGSVDGSDIFGTVSSSNIGYNYDQLYLRGSNGYIGIDTDLPNYQLTVSGDIFSTDTMYASYFVGDGSQITNINIPDSYVKNYEEDTGIKLNLTTLTADTVEFDDGYMTSILCNIIKVHQTDTITPITSTWTPFTWSDTIADETQGNIFSLISDSTIQLNDTGIYMFGGCVHIRNTSGANVDATIGSRIFAASTETRCSQRLWADNLKNNGEITLSYNGTVYISYGDTVQLQYYSTTSDIDFIGNPIFNSQVAATLWMKKGDVGEAK